MKYCIIPLCFALFGCSASVQEKQDLTKAKIQAEILDCSIGSGDFRQMVKNNIINKNDIKEDYRKCVSTWKALNADQDEVYDTCTKEAFKLNGGVPPRDSNKLTGVSPDYISAIEESLYKCGEVK